MQEFLWINGTKVPEPDGYEVSIKDVKKENQTEAGTTQVIKIRKEVYTLTVSFTVKSGWLQKLSAFRNMDELNIKFYDMAAKETRERVMQINDFKANLKKEFNTVKRTAGVWEVSFTLDEF